MKNEAEGKLYTGVDLQSGSIKFFCDPNFDNAKAGQIFEAVENYDRLKARVKELEWASRLMYDEIKSRETLGLLADSDLSRIMEALEERA